MNGYRRLSKALVLSFAFAAVASSEAEDGQTTFSLSQVSVVDQAGAALRGVAARVPVGKSTSHFISIFSNGQGRFDPSALTQGKQTLAVADHGGTEFIGRGYGVVSLTKRGDGFVLKMGRDALRPEDVPAAAWVQSWGTSREALLTTTQCIQCHQLPGRNAQRYLGALGGIDALQPRTDAYHGLIQDMRAMSTLTTSRMSRRRFTEINSNWRTGSEAFLSKRLEDVIAPFLAQNMPRDFSKAKWDPAWDMGSAQATQAVEVEEFQFPAELNSWFREVAFSPLTGTVIGVDLGGNRAYELDPATGERRWIAIPVPDGTNAAPHTINVDRDGSLWVSLEDINGVGRFDPVKRTWRIYQNIFDGSKISHDFATNSQGLVAKDTKGRIWISLVSHNHVAALDPNTGTSIVIELPPRHDGLKEPTLPYGVVMTADGKFIWVSQHASDTVLKVSTETLKVVATVQYPEGFAPRRMTIDDQDQIWVALSGRGALGLIQGDKASKEFALPMAVSYPYNTLWDPVRKHVWIGTANAGELLEFDPKSQKFRRYMLPAHNEAYIRQFSRDPKTGAIWFAYASKLGEKAQVAVVRIAPEKM